MLIPMMSNLENSVHGKTRIRSPLPETTRRAKNQPNHKPLPEQPSTTLVRLTRQATAAATMKSNLRYRHQDLRHHQHHANLRRHHRQNRLQRCSGPRQHKRVMPRVGQAEPPRPMNSRRSAKLLRPGTGTTNRDPIEVFNPIFLNPSSILRRQSRRRKICAWKSEDRGDKGDKKGLQRHHLRTLLP